MDILRPLVTFLGLWLLTLYVIAIMLVRRNFRIDVDPEVRDCPPHEAPSPVRLFTERITQQLTQLGFVRLAHYFLPDPAPNTSQYVAILGSAGGDVASASATFTRVGGSKVVPVLSVHLVRHLHDGRTVNVTNMENRPSMPVPSYRRFHQFPGLTDLDLLYRVFVTLADREGTGVAPKSCSPAELIIEPNRRELDCGVESGHYWLDRSTNAYRLTWKGALRLGLGQVPPVKQIRQRLHLAHALAVLGETGYPRDYPQASYARDLAREAPRWQQELLALRAPGPIGAASAASGPAGRAHVAEPVILDAGDHIGNDFSCLECGYNVRGIRASSPCPECGTPVGESRLGRMLCLCPVEWLKALAGGAALLFWGTITFFVCAAALVLAEFSFGLPVAPAVIGVGFVVWVIVLALGFSRVTQRNLLDSGQWGPGRLARWTFNAGWILFFAASIVRTHELWTLYTTILWSSAILAFIVTPLLLLGHLRRLALRVPNRRLAAWTSGLRLLFAGWALLSALVMGLGQLAMALSPAAVPASAPAVSAGGTGGTVTPPAGSPARTAGAPAGRGPIAGGFGLITCWLAGAPLVLGVYFAVLCRRYRAAFRHAVHQVEWTLNPPDEPAVPPPEAAPAAVGMMPAHPPTAPLRPPTTPQR